VGRALFIVLAVTGCSVRSDPDPREPLREDVPAECVEVYEPLPLGPASERLRCEWPDEPPDRLRDSPAEGMWRELQGLQRAYCEQERARISWLSEAEWADERERARLAGCPLGQMVVLLGRASIVAHPLPRETLAGCTFEERAVAWVERHRALFGVDDHVEIRVYDTRGGRAWFEQLWRGVPVLASMSFSRVDGDHHLSSGLVPSWLMPPTDEPRVTSEEAVLIAFGGSAEPAETRLVVYPPIVERSAALAWAVRSAHVVAYVDALDGTVLASGSSRQE
jgi:hypothetical protein